MLVGAGRLEVGGVVFSVDVISGLYRLCEHLTWKDGEMGCSGGALTRPHAWGRWFMMERYKGGYLVFELVDRDGEGDEALFGQEYG